MPLVPVALALLAGIVVARFTPGVDTGVWIVAMAASTFVGGILLITNIKHREQVLSALFLAVIIASRYI